MNSEEKESVKKGAEEEKASVEQEIPPANFFSLVSLFQLPALQFLGELSDPSSEEKPDVHPQMAKYYIDCLAVLDDKTKGNLADDEKKVIDNVLTQLRLLYVKKAPGGGKQES